MGDDDHFLTPFLEETLPTLGLDAETYGPYITGIFASSSTETTGADDEDDGEPWDVDEFDSVLELLQSSSETHSDDETVWSKFKSDLLMKWKEQAKSKSAEKAEEMDEARRLKEEKLAEEIRLSEEAEKLAQLEKEKQKLEQENNNSEESRLKAALVDRYAYEANDDDNENNDAAEQGGNSSGGAGESINMNKVNAEKTKKELAIRARQESAKSHQSKKAAREATANAKMEKTMKKEERRKRATKGERKR